MQQQKQQFHIHQHPRRLQDDILTYEVYSESTPISTKNIPTFQKINFNNTKRLADDGQTMSFVHQNNGSFVAQANIKLTKKSSILKNGSNQKVVKAQVLNKSQNRENSNTSEKLNTSLLKLKSRNRCNENLNIIQVADNSGSQIYPGIIDNMKMPQSKIYEQQTLMYQQMTQDSLKIAINDDDQWKGLNTQKLHKELAAINNSLERQKGSSKDSKVTSIKDFKKTIAIPNEPLSCQNKLQKDKLLLLKNINQTQKTTTSSQVATPKYIKFKQKTQINKINQQQTKNTDQQFKFNEDYSSSNFHIDSSYNISPLENGKGQQFFPHKISMKNSNQNFPDLNNTCNITLNQSSCLFSNEKPQKKKLSEEDREEMSTTINYTTNNDVSILPNDQFSPKNLVSLQGKKNNNTQKLSLQLQNIVIARVNSLKAKRNGQNQRRTDGPSSPNNLVQNQNCNKSFQFIAQNQNGNNSNGRGGSNGSNPRHIAGINTHQRKNSANQGILKYTSNNKQEKNSQKLQETNKKIKISLADTQHYKNIINNSSQKIYNQKSSQKCSKPYSTKSSRSNSMKKIAKKQKQRNEDIQMNYQNISKIKKDTMTKILTIVNFDDSMNSSQLQLNKFGIVHNTIDNDYNDTRNDQMQQQHYLYSETFSKVQESAREQNHQNTNKIQEKDQHVEVHQEIELMKKELKTKDVVIQSLTDKLHVLEEQIISIQSKDQRDKSQQRIKEAIQSLEQKLEQFKIERDQNNQILEEIKFQSSLQSSSRHSQQQKGKQGHQISQGSAIDDLESLMYYTDREELIQKSIRTPGFEYMGKCEEDVNIIAQGGDIISDGFQDDSCLLMLEKEWQEQQKLLNKAFDNPNNQNNVIYDDEIILEIDDDIRQAAIGSKEKFIKTQKIEIKNKELVDKKQLQNEDCQEDKQNAGLPRGESFCRTLSKKNLLAKIKNAIGKDLKKNNIFSDNGSRKTPRRFIVKRSQERNEPNKQQKITIINQQENKQLDSSLQQQVTILKCMITQKEKIALNQKEALKKEREMSLKLRQAINKIYVKMQNSQKNTQEQC